MDVRQLGGKELNYWVMRALNLVPTCLVEGWPAIHCNEVPYYTGARYKDIFNPSGDISHAWGFLKNDKIEFHWNGITWNAAMAGHSLNDVQHEVWKGCIYNAPDPLTAMLRCKVASVFGEVVDDIVDRTIPPKK